LIRLLLAYLPRAHHSVYLCALKESAYMHLSLLARSVLSILSRSLRHPPSVMSLPATRVDPSSLPLSRTPCERMPGLSPTEAAREAAVLAFGMGRRSATRLRPVVHFREVGGPWERCRRSSPPLPSLHGVENRWQRNDDAVADLSMRGMAPQALTAPRSGSAREDGSHAGGDVRARSRRFRASCSRPISPSSPLPPPGLCIQLRTIRVQPLPPSFLFLVFLGIYAKVPVKNSED
jgi:hypothetical protein